MYTRPRRCSYTAELLPARLFCAWIVRRGWIATFRRAATQRFVNEQLALPRDFSAPRWMFARPISGQRFRFAYERESRADCLPLPRVFLNVCWLSMLETISVRLRWFRSGWTEGLAKCLLGRWYVWRFNIAGLTCGPMVWINLGERPLEANRNDNGKRENRWQAL